MVASGNNPNGEIHVLPGMFLLISDKHRESPAFLFRQIWRKRAGVESRQFPVIKGSSLFWGDKQKEKSGG